MKVKSRKRAESDSGDLGAIDPRYFNPRMVAHINERTCTASSWCGLGTFARRDLPKSTIVGYYSGPVLTWNNEHKYAGQDDYVAGGQFVHPGSGKKMSYHILVVGPTRYMNHGHNPDYFHGEPPDHFVVANVQMQHEEMVKINGRFRPIFAFRTICDIEKGTELLYDYGVHHDEIYYEYLRRMKARDTSARRRRFRKQMAAIKNDRYAAWRDKTDAEFDDEWETQNGFFLDLLIAYLNSPDSVQVPTSAMV